MKRKLFFTVITAVIVVVAVAAVAIFTSHSNDKIPALLPADQSALVSGGNDTPEAIAKKSSETYMDMVDGNISVDDGFETILQLAPSAAAEQMRSLELEVKKQIETTKDYLVANNDSVTGYQFTQTEYKDGGEATIMRIQLHKNGKKYYFQQDFIKENGVWKIKGDNIADPFRIKDKFLWWYI